MSELKEQKLEGARAQGKQKLLFAGLFVLLTAGVFLFLSFPDRALSGIYKRVYVCSLSSNVIVYKGMLTPGQLFPFYTDLEDGRFETHLAMVHSRFSTNTFPSWDRAQPNRYMSHNGEINSLKKWRRY